MLRVVLRGLRLFIFRFGPLACLNLRLRLFLRCRLVSVSASLLSVPLLLLLLSDRIMVDRALNFPGKLFFGTLDGGGKQAIDSEPCGTPSNVSGRCFAVLQSVARFLFGAPMGPAARFQDKL